MYEKLITFNKEDFTEEAWDIICAEMEGNPYNDYVSGLLLMEEDEEEENETEGEEE